MEDFAPISLPSRCAVYPEVDPKTVRIRTFLGEEEEKIQELGIGNPKKKLLEVLRNTITGVDPSILTSGDVAHVLLWQAINSYSPVFPVKLTCESCYRSVDVTVNLGDIESKELPDGFIQPYEVELSYTSVKLRLKTILDDIEVYNFSEAGQSTYCYDYALTMVDDETDVVARLQVLRAMKSQDLIKIRRFHNKFAHGPDYKAEYVCPLCDSRGEVIIPFRLQDVIQESARA